MSDVPEQRQIDGEEVLFADTPEAFARALDTGRPIAAAPDVGRAFGFPEDAADAPEDFLPAPAADDDQS